MNTNLNVDKNKTFSIFRFFINSILIGLMAMTVSLFLAKDLSSNSNSNTDTYFDKTIKDTIALSIKNGANIDIVKHIYLTRRIKTQSILFWNNTDKDIYPEETSLTIILNDIKKEYYIKNIKDSLYLTNLDRLMTTYEEINPFDNLESNQKFMFENVRQKLDTNYIHVQSDLNRISDELKNKNALVNEYLNTSNLSYWISIMGLFVTIILSMYQIYQNRSPR